MADMLYLIIKCGDWRIGKVAKKSNVFAVNNPHPICVCFDEELRRIRPAPTS